LIKANSNGRSMDIVKYLDSYELEKFKNDIQELKIVKYSDTNKKVIPAYYLFLYRDNKIDGFLTIDSINNSCINIDLRDNDYGFTFETNFNFKEYFDEMILKENMNCDQAFKQLIDFNKLSLSEYIDILKIKDPCPNGEYRLTTFGNIGDKWITDSDIENLINLIDSEDPTYCIIQMMSSNLPTPTDYSTLGGQIMDILDAYRLKKQYPYFLSSCSKNDEKRKTEILNWWNDYKKSRVGKGEFHP
jgi:hypothetical protein